MQRDPNRYAEGPEAAALRERIEDEELALDVLRTSYERAQQAHAETEAQFHDAEQQYLLYKGLLEDSSKYLGKARSRYVAQAASVALERVLLHPVRKTPLEILAYIFELCIDDVPCDDQLPVDDDDIRNRQQQPFHLAAVCRRWRQASFAHPRAWRHFELSFDFVKPNNVVSWLGYAATLLSHARSVPLTACLTRTGESKPHHEELVPRVAAILRLCVRAQIMIWSLDIGDSLLPLLGSTTPYLTKLRCRLASLQSDTVLRNMHILPNAPALEFISATNLFHGGPVAFPVLDTAYLHSITCTDEEDVLSIMLRSLPRLSALRLYWPLVAYQTPNPVRLAVPQIKSLFLHIFDDCPIAQLSLRFEFTSVTSLNLYGDPPSADERICFLRALGENSPINELSISDIGGPSFAVFLDVLPSLGSLKTLFLEWITFTNDNLLALRDALCPQDRSAKWPCPHLLAIRFDPNSCTFAADCNPAAITGMIESRASAARDNALAPDNRPTALRWLNVGGWESSGDDESIQDKINCAIRTAP